MNYKLGKYVLIALVSIVIVAGCSTENMNSRFGDADLKMDSAEVTTLTATTGTITTGTVTTLTSTTAGITTGNITTVNATTGNITTVAATTVTGATGTFTGQLSGYRPVHYNMDADSALTTTLIKPGSEILTTAVGAKRTYTLPAAAAGLEYIFDVADSDSIRFTTATGDSILVAGTANKIVASVDLHGTLTAKDATYWVLHGETGTATGY